MSRLSIFSLVFMPLLIGGCTLWAEELTESKYRELLKELQPDETALWRTIPWKTNLLDAQRQAVAESKPIFIWAMDGHPLGCT